MDMNYQLGISPDQAGPATFEVRLTDQQGQPVSQIDTVTLRFVMEDMDMGVQVLDLPPVPQKPGLYSTVSSVQAMAGHWKTTLLIRRTGYEDAKTSFEYNLKE